MIASQGEIRKVKEGRSPEIRREFGDERRDGGTDGSSPGHSRTRLYIKGLPTNWSEVDLFRVFRASGVIWDCTLPPVPDSYTSRYAFVEYSLRTEAKRAIELFNGLQSLEGVRKTSPWLPAPFRFPQPLSVVYCRLNHKKGGKDDSGASPRKAPAFLDHSMGRHSEESESKESETGSVQSPQKRAVGGEEAEAPKEEGEETLSDGGNAAGAVKDSGHYDRCGKNYVELGPREKKVVVTNVESPGEFSVQMEGREAGLKEFQDKLDAYYSEHAEALTPEEAWTMRYCVVWTGKKGDGEKEEEEGQRGGWERGIVLKIMQRAMRSPTVEASEEEKAEEAAAEKEEGDDGKEVTCRLLDSGRTIVVPRVYRLVEDFLDFSFQAIRCQLGGVTPMEGRWTSRSGEVLRDLVKGAETIFATLRSTRLKGTPPKSTIRLVMLKDGKQTDLSDAMIMEGHAHSYTVPNKQYYNPQGKPLAAGPAMVPIFEKVKIGALPATVIYPNTEITAAVVARTPPPGGALIWLFSLNLPTTIDFLNKAAVPIRQSHFTAPNDGDFSIGDVITHAKEHDIARAVVTGIRGVKLMVRNLELGGYEEIPRIRARPAAPILAHWPACAFKCKEPTGQQKVVVDKQAFKPVRIINKLADGTYIVKFL